MMFYNTKQRIPLYKCLEGTVLIQMQRAAYSVIKTSLAPPSQQLSSHCAVTDINGFTSGYRTPTVTDALATTPRTVK